MLYTFLIRTHFIRTHFIRKHFIRTPRLRLSKKLRAIEEQCKDAKKLQGWDWNLTHKWVMNEQNAQAQKKPYNKIRSMPLKSLATT